jgi:uncharacterized membrane protein YhaH (DUF805 family)|tara:strand:- start:387 stop:653 length:267 start_codon:yes stop_codon:yes gene_type:complete
MSTFGELGAALVIKNQKIRSSFNMSFWQIIIFIVLFSLTLLPALIALTSKKAKGIHKLAWGVISLFFSWLGFLIYYFFAIRGMSKQST